MIPTSKSWSELVWPHIWRELENSGFSNDAEIKKVYFLNFGILNEKNLEKYTSLLEKRDLRGLKKFRPFVPLDFDERDYDCIDLVYVETHTNKLIGLCKEFIYGKLELIKLIEIDDLDIDLFRGKRQVYPV